MQSAQHGIEMATIGISNKITVAGGATAVVSSAAERVGVVTMVNQAGAIDVAGWCAIGGVVCAFLGLIVSFYFQWRRDRRENLESELRQKQLLESE